MHSCYRLKIIFNSQQECEISCFFNLFTTVVQVFLPLSSPKTGVRGITPRKLFEFCIAVREI